MEGDHRIAMTDLKLVEPSAIYKDAYLDMRQMNYWGIVIEQSLKDGSVLEDFDLLAKKQIGGWTFRLVSVPEHEMEANLAKLQRQKRFLDCGDNRSGNNRSLL